MSTVLKITNERPVAIILSANSGIGSALAQRFVEDGYVVFGTHRSHEGMASLAGLDHFHWLPLDVSDPLSVRTCADTIAAFGRPWSVWISCVGDLRPIGSFLETDIDAWIRSLHVNALDQLRAFHMMAGLRVRQEEAHAIFFAGGGTNTVTPGFSAYTASKIMLIKMCEQLAAEVRDLNPFIIGPGWTQTKIHQQTLAAADMLPEEIVNKTRLFVEQEQEGTPPEDIYQCIRWGMRHGRSVVGGRNISVVHDPWRGSAGDILADRLRGDPNTYTLRRHGNSQ